MPAYSMTGFGRGESVAEGRKWVVELRSVNHRFFDCRVKLPSAYSSLEEGLKKKANAVHERGRVELFVQLQGEQPGLGGLAVNIELARQYYDCLCRLADALSIDERPSLMDVAAHRDVLTIEQNNPDVEAEWPLISEALDLALEECARMRGKEGERKND